MDTVANKKWMLVDGLTPPQPFENWPSRVQGAIKQS